MRLERKAYSVIYRLRRKKGSPEIDTKARTIYLPCGTDEADMSRPSLRLVFEFGFAVQYIIKQ